MTVAAAQISESLQTLIDSRLDTIDRMLLGRVSRQDRLAIVREVESQIHELLQERNTDELTREDVLAVLARLDPPEAYLSDESGSDSISVHSATPARTGQPRLNGDVRVGRASGALGVTAVVLPVLLPVNYLIAVAFGSEVVLFVLIGVTLLSMFFSSVLAVALGAHARKSGPWALVGIVTGSLAFFLCLATTTALVAWLLSIR